MESDALSEYYDQCSFFGPSHVYQSFSADSYDYSDNPRLTNSESPSGCDPYTGDSPEVEVTQTGASVSQAQELFQYSINVINPQKKSEGRVQKLRNLTVFSSLMELKEQVGSILKVQDSSHFVIGYYEPGHGSKGKKRWLMDDEDVTEMLRMYTKKKEILLWCHDPEIEDLQTLKRKRKLTAADDEVKAKSRSRFVNAYEKKMAEVEEVYQTLEKKHGSTWTPEQLRAWANMYQMKKHTSLDVPPTGRFFGKHASKVSAAKSDTNSANEVCGSPNQAMSPTKRVSLRTQCIEQLERWHQLMEKGGITKEQYDELQDSILSEIKQY